MRSIAAIAAVAAAGFSTQGAASDADASPRGAGLDAVERAVVLRYPSVPQIDADALQALRDGTESLILLDVREADEFAVSRLPGAIPVDPDADVVRVTDVIGALPPGAVVVMYCSVGVRSSRLAERVQLTLAERGANVVANLRGGIFRWHGERRSLVDERGATDAIHGDDANWTRLLPSRAAAVVVKPD
ncbi:MAG: rhodanese-like domain-containing protein [Panacagrimonas sp.]